MQDYSDKSDQYFAAARKEIEPLLPSRAEAVLEVGCGTGATLRWLKESGRAGHTTGIELFESAARTARPVLDRLLVGDAESIAKTELAPETFDLVLCLDVLEHMVDPWAFVECVGRLLRPGGTFIASIPNVRHLSVLIDLVVRGRWTYRSVGILDRTHLRFFTRSTATALMTTGALRPSRLLYNIGPVRSNSGLLNLLTFGTLRGFLATQFLLSSTKVRAEQV